MHGKRSSKLVFGQPFERVDDASKRLITRSLYVLIVISPSPDCKILSIPYLSRVKSHIVSHSSSARERAFESNAAAHRSLIIAPLVLKTSVMCAQRSSQLQYSPFAHRFLARVTYCLVPTRVKTTRTTRQSSTQRCARTTTSTRDRRRVRARLSVITRWKHTYLDDDERSPELIEC